MARPTKRAESRFYQARKRVPKELQSIVGRTEFKRSLRATSLADVKLLHSQALAEFDRIIAAARARLDGELRSLTDREISALSGVWYRQHIAEIEAEGPIDAKRWETEEDLLTDRIYRSEEDPDWWDFTPSKRDLVEAELFLEEQGLVAKAASLARFAEQLHLTKIAAARTLIRRGHGDFGPDQVADRFAKELPPVALAAPAEPPAVAPGSTFSDLVRAWARDQGHNPDAKPVPVAYYEKHRTAARLAAFVGHEDATRLSKADVHRWKLDGQGKGRSPKTIRNDISDMSAVFTWAVRHGLLPVNVFTGMLPSLRNAATVDSDQRTYTDEQVATLLSAARQQTGALRWLPWVLALTGARLDEVTQSNKADIQTIDGVLCLRIHADEDGTRQPGERRRRLKNTSSRRNVPLHAAMIAEGFLDYVAALPDRSPLFPDIPYGGNYGARSITAQRWMRSFVRGCGITDPYIRPSHSLRHWFVTAARKAQIRREVSDAITGHKRKENEADSYGTPLREMTGLLAEAMARIVVPKVPDRIKQNSDRKETTQ